MQPTENARVRNVSVRVLADDWYVLRKATFEFLRSDGSWQQEEREAYDRGNGAVVLLHDPDRGKVLLTRQFRWPAYANGHPDGMLIEACAGLLDDADPETAIRREAHEETGVQVGELRALFTSYMSPGSVTEQLHFYYATYSGEQGRGDGGGLADEGEDIEVLELDVDEALAMVRSGEIADAKTIMLLQWLAAQRAVD
ncbi:MAG TPA: NUDIX domain-containing protein [Solirubrobacteraceae bacterium]|jgi:nudix-type nucleoside diphosphatase (YffH/AdpP family)